LEVVVQVAVDTRLEMHLMVAVYRMVRTATISVGMQWTEQGVVVLVWVDPGFRKTLRVQGGTAALA
jgi:hypothetical protein